MKNIAIILASGKGKRLKSKLPKQFIKVNNKMILEYSLSVFQNNKHIDEICIVYPKNYLKYVKPLTKKYLKIKKLVLGGKERFNSSYNALFTYKDEDLDNTNVLIHDAVRPLIDDKLISKTISKLKISKIVLVGLKARDTLLKVKNKKNIIIERDDVYYLHTPQSFRLKYILNSYTKTKKLKRNVSDDSSVFIGLYPDIKINIINSDIKYFKITHNEDISFFKSFIKKEGK